MLLQLLKLCCSYIHTYIHVNVCMYYYYYYKLPDVHTTCGTYEASYTYIHELTYYMHDTYIHDMYSTGTFLKIKKRSTVRSTCWRVPCGYVHPYPPSIFTPWHVFLRQSSIFFVVKIVCTTIAFSTWHPTINKQH